MTVTIGGDGAIATDPENTISRLQSGVKIDERACCEHWLAGPPFAVKLICPSRRTGAHHPDGAIHELDDARVGAKVKPIGFVVHSPFTVEFPRHLHGMGEWFGPFETQHLSGFSSQPDSARTVLARFAKVETIGQLLSEVEPGQNLVGQQFHPNRRVTGILFHQSGTFPAGVENPVMAPVPKDAPARGDPNRAVASDRHPLYDRKRIRDGETCFRKGPKWIPVLAREPGDSPRAAAVDDAAGAGGKSIDASAEAICFSVSGPLQAVIGPGPVGRAEPDGSRLALADALDAEAVQLGKNAPAPRFVHRVFLDGMENLGGAGRA